MIESISYELGEIEVPMFHGELKMLPFNLENLDGVPEQFVESVSKMVSFLPMRKGVAFLTTDGKELKKGETLRRGGAHIDGNYLKEGDWGKGGGNGWKVGGDGRSLSPEEHKLSYENETGGMLIVSNKYGCKGWKGVFDGVPSTGGDCSHISLGEGFRLKPNRIYYGNSQWIHESVPVEENTQRCLIRITLPLGYPKLINF